jgi:cell division septation protein DedD/DNA-binding response OmpR family regulator
MARQTIVVIDAGPDLEQRITTTLEAANYTVFTGPSGVVGPDVLKNLAPSLIYVKPLAPSRAGFEPCKTIHAHAGLKHIPIVLLASLRGSLDSRYFNIYGIVDSLKPSFTSEELLEKTEMVLGNVRPSWFRGPDELMKEEPALHIEEGKPGMAGEGPAESGESAIERTETREEEPDGLSWLRGDEKEVREGKAARTAPWSQAAGEKERKRPSFLIAAVGAAILLVVVGAVIWLYRPVPPPRKAELSPAPAPSSPSPKVPDSGPASKLPPLQKPSETVAPPAPSTPPAQPVQTVQGPPPSPEAPSRPTRKPVYSVQLGVFKVEDNARALEKGLREKGYDTFTRPAATRDGSPLYRVLAGKFEDRAAAEKLAEEIQSKENIKPAIRRE